MLFCGLSSGIGVNEGDVEGGGVRLFAEMDETVGISAKLHCWEAVIGIFVSGYFEF